MKNTILNSGSAIIRGQFTGLAGCSNQQCQKPCIR